MKKLCIILYAVCIVFSAAAQRTVIHCGNLIDGKANDVQPQMTIVVEGNKIISVEKGFTKPGSSDKLIDLSKKTVLPGLVDMHVHLEGETNKDQNLQRFTLNDADIAFRSTVFAKKTLLAGFTTVRDLGDVDEDVGALVVRRKEAEALVDVEPAHCSLCHVAPPSSGTARCVVRVRGPG